jgi:hypothetical protein
VPLAEGGAALAGGTLSSSSPARLLRREDAEDLVVGSKVSSKVSKAYRLVCLFLVARGGCGERRPRTWSSVVKSVVKSVKRCCCGERRPRT